VWTLNPGISFGRKGGANTSGLQVEELNFLGLGTQLGVGYKSGVDRDSKTAFYRDRQLGSSWWDLSARFSDNSDGRRGAFSLERPFFALDTRWAAGLLLNDDRRIDSRYIGRSAGLRNAWVRRWKLGASLDQGSFAHAANAPPSQQLPAQRDLLYPWAEAEWLQDEFRTERNRDQIEKTEDVALGWRARLQLGYASTALRSDRNAVMLAAAVSKGRVLSERQTLLLDLSAHGRIERGAFADSLVAAESRYYFRQSPRRLFFASLAAQWGQNLDAGRQILLGGDSGLRGYPLRYQAGTGRWLFTAEQRVFTNWYPFQLVHVGGTVFYDMGQTWGQDPFTSRSQGLLKDVGIGLRLGNSRSALGNVLHIDVAFPLDGDSSIKRVQFVVETKRRF
jgi:outer membrane protein assembly factor BamA